MLIETPIQVQDLACALALEIEGPATGQVLTVGNLDDARPGTICALFERRFIDRARETNATVVLVSPQLSPYLPDTCSRLISTDPRTDWGRLLRLLFPKPRIVPPVIGRHPSSFVEASAQLDESVAIGAQSYVGDGANLGVSVHVFPGCYVGHNVSIGAHSILMPGARVLDGCQIGAHCWIGPGAVIGSVGFGLDALGRVPHLGAVHIGANTTIGANTCIDRGSINDTVIGSNVHLDNLVQVGHNVSIGDGVVVCGQAGIAGGTRIGESTVIGGQAGLAGHLEIGQGVRLAAQSGVTRSLPHAGEYSGHPAEPNRARLKRIAKLKKLIQ